MGGRGDTGGVPGLIPAHDLQDEGEDVDDISVDGEGTVDIFLGAQRVLPVPQHKLGVIGKELWGQRVSGMDRGQGRGRCSLPDTLCPPQPSTHQGEGDGADGRIQHVEPRDLHREGDTGRVSRVLAGSGQGRAGPARTWLLRRCR